MKEKFFVAVMALLMLSFTVSGQSPDKKDIRKLRKENRELIQKGGYDFVTDPIEMAPIAPNDYSAELESNWAYSFYGMESLKGQVLAGAKKKVAVVVFDTGLNGDHEALKPYILTQYCKSFTGETVAGAKPAWYDENGHGTHVGSLAAGYTSDRKLGVAGDLSASGYVYLVSVKVLNKAGAGMNSWIVSGIQYANTTIIPALKDQGFGIVYNMSFGAPGTNASIDNVIVEAEKLGAMVLCAAGNTGGNGIGMPANGPSAHAIAAIDQTPAKAGFSTSGDQLYLSAPGVLNLGAYLGNSYVKLSGTSMATPTMAGVVAVVWSQFPTATNRQISRYLAKRVKDIPPAGWDIGTGFGYSWISEAINGNPLTEPDTGNGRPSGGGGGSPDNPTKGSRDLVFVHTYNYKVFWKPITQVGGNFRIATVNFNIKYKTDLYADAAFDKVKAVTDWFFTNRGFVLTADADFNDAGYWAGAFLKLLAKNEKGLVIDVSGVVVRDEANRTALVNVPASAAGAKIKMLFNPEVSTLTGTWFQ